MDSRPDLRETTEMAELQIVKLILAEKAYIYHEKDFDLDLKNDCFKAVDIFNNI